MFRKKISKTVTYIISAAILVSGATFNTAAIADPFIGEIKWVPYNFAPRGWAFCDGQLLPISSNQALFALIGTTYGGDGRTTFALPDVRGRVMVHEGTGPGLTNYRLGSKVGTESTTLNTNQLPAHNHSLQANNGTGSSTTPENNLPAATGLPLAGTAQGTTYAPPPSGSTGTVSMHNSAVGSTGGNAAVGIRQPSLTLNCIIALQGIFPSRD